MLNISSSLRGIGKKNFFVCSVYSAFLAGREIGKLFFWKAFLTFSLSISERSKIECGDVCTMRENNGFALLYNVCLLVWTTRLFPLVKRTKWCQTVTIGDDDSHRARARAQKASFQVSCGLEESSFLDLLRPRFDYSNDQVAFTPCALHYREMHFYFIFIT